MAQTGGEMPDAGVGVELFGCPGNDAVDKIAEMIGIGAPFEPGGFVAVAVKNDDQAVTELDHVPFGPVGDHADAGFHQRIGFETARLEDEGAPVAVIVNRDFGVGGVAGVDIGRIVLFDFISKTAAVGDDRRRKFGLAQEGARNVGLMRPLVPDIAVAVKALPVPAVMEPRPRHRPDDRRRPAPEVIIDAVRNRIGAPGPDRPAAVVAEAADQVDLAEFPLGGIRERLLNGGIRTALGTDLAASAVFFGGGDKRLTLVDVVADRLFNIGVFPRLHRPDAAERVPVVRGRAADDIDVFVVEPLAHIAYFGRTDSGLIFNGIGNPGACRRIGIADAENARAAVGEIFGSVIASAAAAADDHHAERFIRSELTALRTDSFRSRHGTENGGGRRGDRGVAQELSSGNSFHSELCFLQSGFQKKR